MKKALLIIAAILPLTACTGMDNKFDWKKPVMLSTNAPEGPYNYRKGWSDGCQSGLASTNTNFHMSIGSQKFTLDEKLRYDRLYNTAWKYAYNHCGYSMRTLAMYNL